MSLHYSYSFELVLTAFVGNRSLQYMIFGKILNGCLSVLMPCITNDKVSP